MTVITYIILAIATVFVSSISRSTIEVVILICLGVIIYLLTIIADTLVKIAYEDEDQNDTQT